MIGERLTGTLGRQFKVIREIGRGGFGIVYLAEAGDGQSYAVKLMAPVADPAIRLSFEQELKSTEGLAHENLLSIIDYGACPVGTKHGLFAVTEYCPDGDYRRSLSSYAANQIDIGTIVQDFRQILAGLSVLHTRIVHRDIKPENVLVAAGKLKVGDFGLAKFVDEATRTLTFKGDGTPRYMAPEVWFGQHATAATDLYAIGVMLFEALAGRAPFSGPDTNALREMHCYTPAPRVRSFNANVPEMLDGIIKKLLAKDPRARYQTAAEVLDALQTAPAPSESAIGALAARMRHHHDAAEAATLEQRRIAESERDTAARNRYKEQEILAMVDDVVEEVNQHLAETKIVTGAAADGKEYRFGGRALRVRFFHPGQLFLNPIVPGRMATLRQRHVAHGGYIEIKEHGQDREGWNLVLVRRPEDLYGEWRLVETRLSAFSGRSTPFEPFATEAQLFADNLANHWATVMHVFNLTDKPLERADIVKILDVFIPR
jgi:serine/threonine-protein kinase